MYRGTAYMHWHKAVELLRVYPQSPLYSRSSEALQGSVMAAGDADSGSLPLPAFHPEDRAKWKVEEINK